MADVRARGMLTPVRYGSDASASDGGGSSGAGGSLGSSVSAGGGGRTPRIASSSRVDGGWPPKRWNPYRYRSRPAATVGAARMAPPIPNSAPPIDERHDQHRGMQVDRVAHHLRHEDVVLELLDDDVEHDRREPGHRGDREADEDRRDGGHDRADDREPLEHAGDQREDQHELAELAEPDEGQDREADDRGQEDRRAEQELAADPLAADPPEEREDVLGVGAPARRHGRGHRSREALAVLEDEEQPHRHDDEADEERRRADDRADRRRQQAGEEVGDRLAGRGELLLERLANVGRQRQALVPLDQCPLGVADRRAELGQLLDELAGLLGDRREGEGEHRPDHGNRGGIRDQHAGPARHAAACERGHHRVEHEGQRQADEEDGQRPARRPQQQQDDDDHQGREDRLAVTLHGVDQRRHRVHRTRRLWPSRVAAGTMSGP